MKLNQKNLDACLFFAVWDLLSIHHNKITQEEVEEYYNQYLKEKKRTASNITSLAEYSKAHPIHGMRIQATCLFNRNYKNQSNFLKQEQTIQDSLKIHRGLLLNLKMQTPKLPIKDGYLIHLGEGFGTSHHAVVLTHFDKYTNDWSVENWWNNLYEFKIKTKDLLELAQSIYNINFKPL